MSDKMARLKFKKALIVTITTIAIAVVFVIVFISPLTKHFIEKYDEKYSGRKVTLDWAYVNPFTGYIYFSNLKIYEHKSDSIFFSTKGLSANFSVYKLLSKTYEISNITLDQPKGVVIQNKKDWNFDDLVELFTPKRKSTEPKSPAHVKVLNIKINNGELRYIQQEIPINYFIKNLNIESDGVRWDADTFNAKFSFLTGIGKGYIGGDFTMNVKNLNYHLAAVINKFDLNIIGQYLKDLSNYGSFRANLDAKFNATGNFKSAQDLDARGQLAINDFHFGKNPHEDYASFNKFTLVVKKLSPKNKMNIFDSVLLSKPFFKYELYDHLDNVQTVFGKKGSNITAIQGDPERFNLVLEIAGYLEKLSKNFFKNYYKINRLEISDGDLKFDDYSLNEKFSIAANPFSVEGDSIDKNRKRVNLHLKSGIKPYGNTLVNLSINPQDTSDFDLDYNLEKISLAMINPYLITYTSYPLDRGSMECKGVWNVRNGIIQSKNNITLIDPHIAQRIKKRNTKRLPLPLIMGFIRERGNVIDYDIPITGDLKNPKFNVLDVIIDLVENILIKPPTIPYAIKVSSVENEIKNSLNVNWEMQKSSLSNKQESSLSKIADFLEDNPEASLSIYPKSYAEKEKEYILFYEAKKKYFQLKNKNSVLSEEDSLTIDKLSIKDPEFVQFLDKQINDTMMFTIQEKCNAFLNSTIVTTKFNQLQKQRESLFRSYFMKNGTDKRIKILSNENTVPYNGFSYYKINYKGDIPESLISAYMKLNDMDNKIPRKKYLKERKINSQATENQKNN